MSNIWTYFKPADFFNPETMDKNLLDKLLLFREDLKSAINITSSNKPDGHSTDSFHYKNMATDCTVKNNDKLLIFLTAIKYFNGVGYYTGGFWHFDVRLEPMYWISKCDASNNPIDYVYHNNPNEFNQRFADYICDLKVA